MFLAAYFILFDIYYMMIKNVKDHMDPLYEPTIQDGHELTAMARGSKDGKIFH